MIANFYGWNDEPGSFVPQNCDLLISYEEYSTIMQALKCFAIEWDYYDDVERAVNLATELKRWYKNAQEEASKRKK